MSQPTIEELKALILYKLRRKGYWGSRYTPIKNAIRFVPSHLRGKAKNAIEEMLKNRLLLPHKRKECISLNVKRKRDITESIKKHR